MKRYWVQIRFKGNHDHTKVWDILSEFKTLREAQSYKTIIDSTVAMAQIFDTVKKEVVESWL